MGFCYPFSGYYIYQQVSLSRRYILSTDCVHILSIEYVRFLHATRSFPCTDLSYKILYSRCFVLTAR